MSSLFSRWKKKTLEKLTWPWKAKLLAWLVARMKADFAKTSICLAKQSELKFRSQCSSNSVHWWLLSTGQWPLVVDGNNKQMRMIRSEIPHYFIIHLYDAHGFNPACGCSIVCFSGKAYVAVLTRHGVCDRYHAYYGEADKQPSCAVV